MGASNACPGAAASPAGPPPPPPPPRRACPRCAPRRRLSEALAQPFPDRLQFVLGTESGMITSIVRKVRPKLLLE